MAPAWPLELPEIRGILLEPRSQSYDEGILVLLAELSLIEGFRRTPPLVVEATEALPSKNIVLVNHGHKC